MATKSELRPGSDADIAFGSTTVTVTAPTVAEVNALTRIECWIPGDGSVTTPRSASYEDISSLCEPDVFEKTIGVTNGAIGAQLWRYIGGSDEAYTLFDDTVVPRPTQTLIICRTGFDASGAGLVAVAGDLIDIYTVEVAMRMEDDLSKEQQRFSVEMPVSARYMQVTVVA